MTEQRLFAYDHDDDLVFPCPFPGCWYDLLHSATHWSHRATLRAQGRSLVEHCPELLALYMFVQEKGFAVTSRCLIGGARSTVQGPPDIGNPA